MEANKPFSARAGIEADRTPPGPDLAHMFGQVVGRYDFLNHLLSLNRDRVWRQALVNRMTPWPPGARILDLATGTGDQLAAIKKAYPGWRLTGVDFSGEMLAVARSKLAGLPGPVPEIFLDDVLRFPYEEASFEAVTISFGLRNIPERAALYERVMKALKPGGLFLVLEMYFDREAAWSAFYRFYLSRIIPLIGRLAGGRENAYRYLAESIMKFPPPLEIKAELALAGLSEIGHQSYSFNAVMLVWGRKPPACPAS